MCLQVKLEYMDMKVNTPSLNVSTTPITAMGYQQFLSLSVVQLKGKLCLLNIAENPIAVMGL